MHLSNCKYSDAVNCCNCNCNEKQTQTKINGIDNFGKFLSSEIFSLCCLTLIAVASTTCWCLESTEYVCACVCVCVCVRVRVRVRVRERVRVRVRVRVCVK